MHRSCSHLCCRVPHAPAPMGRRPSALSSLSLTPYSLALALASCSPTLASTERVERAQPWPPPSSALHLLHPIAAAPLAAPPSMPPAPRPPPQTLGGAETHRALLSAIAVVLAAWPPTAAGCSRMSQGLVRPQLAMAKLGRPLPATAGSRWPSPAGPCSRCSIAVLKRRAKDHGHKFDEVGGPKCEAITHRNSTKKGQFADI